MWLSIILNVPLKPEPPPIVKSYVLQQTLLVTESSVIFPAAMTDVEILQTKAKGRFSRICSPGTERCASDGYTITTSSEATTLQINLTEILLTSLNVVVHVYDHTPVADTLGPFAGVDDTTATSKMEIVLTHIAIIDSLKNDTTYFSGNESDITRANYSTESVSRLLRNDSWEFNPPVECNRQCSS